PGRAVARWPGPVHATLRSPTLSAHSSSLRNLLQNQPGRQRLAEHAVKRALIAGLFSFKQREQFRMIGELRADGVASGRREFTRSFFPPRGMSVAARRWYRSDC